MGAKTIPIRRQGAVGQCADYLLLPLMYLVQGTMREIPQRTHRWNNQHLHNYEISDLQAALVEIVPGDPTAARRWLGPIPLFHLPVFGGWKKFVVVQPKDSIAQWFVGWVAFDALGVSMIPLKGPVRLGVGPRQAQFFGVNEHGEQIDIDVIGEGVIGKAGVYARLPLL